MPTTVIGFQFCVVWKQLSIIVIATASANSLHMKALMQSPNQQERDVTKESQHLREQKKIGNSVVDINHWPTSYLALSSSIRNSLLFCHKKPLFLPLVKANPTPKHFHFCPKPRFTTHKIQIINNKMIH